MNVTYACPQCDAPLRQDFDESTTELTCPACSQRVETPPGAVEGNQVRRCLVCPSTDLYVRKDFPQRLGVALVAVGIIGSSIAWSYGSLLWTWVFLFGTALADVVLYLFVGEALMCYRCGAIYRGVAEMDAHGGFDLETHERYRQMAARMKS